MGQAGHTAADEPAWHVARLQLWNGWPAVGVRGAAWQEGMLMTLSDTARNHGRASAGPPTECMRYM